MRELSAKPKRGLYIKYSPKDKARIRNYALLHGTPAAV